MFKRLHAGDPHYLYALVDRKTKHVGYFGVTNDPVKRRQDHLYEYRHPYEKRGKGHGGRMKKWVEKFGRAPEMVIIAVFPSRIFCEIVERCLIRNFNAVGQIVSNEYKYHNSNQMAAQMVLDDIPFWEIDLEKEGWSPFVVRNMASIGSR